ncbi:hypothetical protein NXS19_008530 [Fusarium pseudograminearum]|nr:hypothetical protein NXS19_008530 [Fusarium pseudograminearum]
MTTKLSQQKHTYAKQLPRWNPCEAFTPISSHSSTAPPLVESFFFWRQRRQEVILPTKRPFSLPRSRGSSRQGANCHSAGC